jgi:serine O-acetyltransferase
MGLFRLISGDYRRYRTDSKSALETIFLTQGFWASTVYRVSHHLLTRIRYRVLRRLVERCAGLLKKPMEILTGINIPPECEIGEGLFIAHFGPIHFPARGGRLGKNYNITEGVAIGVGGRGDERGLPTLGDRVHVGVNAIIIGRITIGDDAAIAAGAVVTRSVPPRAVVMGNRHG